MVRTGSQASHAAAASLGPSHAASLPTALRQAVQLAAGRADTQPPGAHEQALEAALGSHLASRADAEPGEPVDLDLSKLDPDALALFTEPVARQVQLRLGSDAVAAVVLPGNTRSLPAGIGALAALQKLVLPGFTGTQLDLGQLLAGRTATHPALWISTPGSKTLREILVLSVRQASQALRFDLRTEHSRKVTLVDKALRRPVPGRAYDREALGRDAKDQKTRDVAYERSTKLNLNCQVSFEGMSERIACRHLATAHAFRMIEHRRGPAVAKDGTRRLDYKAFSTPETLQDAVPATDEARFEQVTARSRDNHLVALTHWDAFLRSQAAGMAPGQCRQFLVVSCRHAMHMELQVKRREEGELDWVVSFYDPNRTTTHRRAVVDRSGAVPTTLASLLPNQEALEQSFGSRPETTTALVIGIPEDLHAGSQRHDTKARPVDSSHAGDHCTPSEVFLRLWHNLAHGLDQRLDRAFNSTKEAAGLAPSSRSTLLDLLQSSADHTPALFVALQEGHADAAQALLQAAMKAASLGHISRSELLQVLEAVDPNRNPALFAALLDGHADAARALLDTAMTAAGQNCISRDQLLHLLQARDGHQTPALFVALQRGHADAARALLDTAMKAADLGRISDGELVHVLQAKDGKHNAALFAALLGGHADAAQALLDTAMTAARQNRMSNEELLHLLQAENAAGLPATYVALERGHADAAKALLSTATKAAVQRRISQEELLGLLRAERPHDGIPALFMVLQAGDARAARALLDTAMKAAHQRGISNHGLMDLLAATRPSDDTPALFMAMMRGHSQAAQVLLQTAMRAVDDGLIAPAELLALLQARSATGAPRIEECLRATTARVALPVLLESLGEWATDSALGRQALGPLLLGPIAAGGSSVFSELLVQGQAEAASAWASAALQLAHEFPPQQSGALPPQRLSQWLSEARSALAAALRSPAPSAATVGGLRASAGAWVAAVLDSRMAPQDKAALLLHPWASNYLLETLATLPGWAAQHQGKLRALLDALVAPAADRKARGVAATDASALQALSRAFMAANLHDWVSVLAESLAASGLPPQVCAEILLAREPSAEPSALSVAMERGNTLAVQAWVRAVLALPLEPTAKKALLVVRAAGGGQGTRGVAGPEAHWTTRLAWAQCIARATHDELTAADKLALLERAQMSHVLLQPARWAAPQPGRRPDGKPHSPKPT